MNTMNPYKTEPTLSDRIKALRLRQYLIAGTISTLATFITAVFLDPITGSDTPVAICAGTSFTMALALDLGYDHKSPKVMGLALGAGVIVSTLIYGVMLCVVGALPLPAR